MPDRFHGCRLRAVTPRDPRALLSKARELVALDLTLVRAHELAPAARGRLLAARYGAMAADRRAIAYLGHTFHYDNRLLPALLPGYLEEICRLDSTVNLSTAGTVLDVGANVGQFAATVAWRFPHLSVWSFEPNPAALGYLQRNAAQTPGWHVLPWGIAPHEVEIPLWYVPGKSAQASHHQANATIGLAAHDLRQATVLCRPLDQRTLTDAGIPPAVDVVKIDVEGAEESVLRGLTELEWRHLLIETSNNREGGLDLASTIDLVSELWGRTPELLWASDRGPAHPTRDAILRLPS